MDASYAQSVILPTKSMQKIVTSIATKVTQLIITSSDTEEKSLENSSSLNALSCAQLVSSSRSILSSLTALVKVTKQTTSNEYFHDEAVSEEVEVASQNLLIAGENLIMCCQVLASTASYSNDSIKSPENQITDLTACISKTFQALIILLLCIDNAEVRKLVSLANSALDRLGHLTTADTMETLVDYFNTFAATVNQFHMAASQRCTDLLSSNNHSRMCRALTTLQHSMPMLTTALSMAIKYPSNDEAISSKLFATEQIEKTINEIVAVIKSRPDESNSNRDGQIGTFVAHTQSLDKLLSPEMRYDFANLELQTVVQSLVQHLMSLTVYASNSAPNLSKKSNYLVRACQNLIEQTCAVAKMSNKKVPLNLHTDTDNAENTSEYGSVCRVVRGKLKSLVKCTNSIVVSLISHTFAITTEPLTDLVRVYNLSKQKQNAQILLKLKSVASTLESHYKDIVQVSKFASMCCADSFVHADMQSHISTFESTSSQIVERILDFATSNIDAEFNDPGAAAASLESLTSEWRHSLNDLIHFCSMSLDLSQLTASIESDVISEFERCHEQIVNLDDISLSAHIIKATGKAKIMGMVADGVVSTSSDPVYRNGVLAHEKQMNDAVLHVIASGNQLIEDTARLASQEAFLAAASSLKTRVGSLRVSLLSKSNHPQLTSDDRKGLRDFSDQTKITGMIREMHNLNQKLSALGFQPKVDMLQFSQDDAGNSSAEKTSAELVDELLGTSGPPVTIDFDREDEEKDNLVSFGRGIHPLAAKLIETCNLENVDRKPVEVCVDELKQMTCFLNKIVDDSEPCLSSTKVLVCDIFKTPFFLTDQEDQSDSHSLTEVVSVWKRSLNESFNLIEGCCGSTSMQRNSKMLKSLCQSWSKSYRILTGCCVRVLQIYSACVKRYLSISETANDDVSSRPSHTKSDSPAVDASSLFEKPNDGLHMLGRVTETLSVLLSDVIALYKRDKFASKAVMTRLNAMQERQTHLASDIDKAKKELKEITSGLDSGSDQNGIKISWLHIHSLICASKLCSLSSVVDTVVHMAIGIRKQCLPVHYFLHGDTDSLNLIAEYRSKLPTLTTSTVEKTNKFLQHRSLDAADVYKLHKVRDRIEISSGSIEKILEFLLSQKFSESLISRHGYLVCHLWFLHHRFLLEVSRISLILKALTTIDQGSDQPQGPQTLQVHFPEEQLPKNTNLYTEGGDGMMSNESKQQQSFNDRLATLTKERKDREKELFYLLSDIDADRLPTELREVNRSIGSQDESEC